MVIAKIFRNSSYLLISQTLVKVISFFYTIFLARSLDVASFGIYTVALSYFALISAIADMGLTRFFLREGAKDKENLESLLFVVSFLRISLIAIIFGILSVAFYIFDPEKLRVAAILVLFIGLFPQALALMFESVFVSLQKFSFSAIGQLLLNVSTVIIGILLLKLKYDLFGPIIAMILAHIIYGAYYFIGVRKLKIRILNQVSLETVKKILKSSLPYGILSIIGLISFRADSIILSYTRGNFETGIYGAAYKFYDAISFVPAIVATVLFPVVAGMFVRDFGNIKNVVKKSVLVMVPLGILVTISFNLILPMVIKIFLPKYILSIDAIRILSLAIPFMFAHLPLGQIILSTEKYLKASLVIFSTLMLINMALYLLLIPRFGYVAASWITVLGEGLTFSTFLSFLYFKLR